MGSIKNTRRIAALILEYTLIAAAIGVPAWVSAAGGATRGEQLYESRCMGCHALDANRIGPMHRGVFGRKAGSVADFDYSTALKRSKVMWNA